MWQEARLQQLSEEVKQQLEETQQSAAAAELMHASAVERFLKDLETKEVCQQYSAWRTDALKSLKPVVLTAAQLDACTLGSLLLRRLVSVPLQAHGFFCTPDLYCMQIAHPAAPSLKHSNSRKFSSHQAIGLHISQTDS